MLNFYDFEVFKHDWLVVIICPQRKEKTVIINDRQKLAEYHKQHKDEIWVGYNSRNYDQYILKGILLGFDPKKLNDFMIVKRRKGWEFSSLFNNIQLYNYDCMDKQIGLKQLEGFMGNDMRETSVPFDIDRKLTADELAMTVKYCTHDVEQTMEVFLKNKSEFDAHIDMIKTFDLSMADITKTQAQLSALALGCVKRDWTDEWEYRIIDTLRIEKYKDAVRWFEEQRERKDYEAVLTMNVCGVPHQFAWGGLHGAIGEIKVTKNGKQMVTSKPVHRKGLLIHVDVTSFYPSIMIRYDMLSRNVKDKSVYKKIYDTRVALKKAGKKKEQAPYKIILNATYGICKDKYSKAYDPRRANEVCVNGQLLLLDLLEHLEGHCDLIQSNTDGLIIQIPDTDEAFDRVDDICFEWESRTGMGLGFDTISEIWQKDVNNYIFRFTNGKIERKGAYVKELSDLDNDLPIVNKALVARMVDGVPVERTVNGCHNLKEFQKIVKVSSKYECGWHNGRKLQDKTFRVFASKDESNTFIGKVKVKKGIEVVEKFANTPEHCVVMNNDVNSMEVPEDIDRDYYIIMANKRLQQFGV